MNKKIEVELRDAMSMLYATGMLTIYSMLLGVTGLKSGHILGGVILIAVSFWWTHRMVRVFTAIREQMKAPKGP